MDSDHIRELFSQFRPVEVRRMFGGVGISAEGLTFAIAFEGVIYLRANLEMVPELKERGSKPFVYPYAKYRRVRKNPDAAPFWRMPEHLYDDPTEAARWAERALEIARRSKTGKRTKSGGKKLAVKAPAGKLPAKKRPSKSGVKKSSGKKAVRRT